MKLYGSQITESEKNYDKYLSRYFFVRFKQWRPLEMCTTFQYFIDYNLT